MSTLEACVANTTQAFLFFLSILETLQSKSDLRQTMLR